MYVLYMYVCMYVCLFFICLSVVEETRGQDKISLLMSVLSRSATANQVRSTTLFRVHTHTNLIILGPAHPDILQHNRLLPRGGICCQ